MSETQMIDINHQLGKFSYTHTQSAMLEKPDEN